MHATMIEFAAGKQMHCGGAAASRGGFRPGHETLQLQYYNSAYALQYVQVVCDLFPPEL